VRDGGCYYIYKSKTFPSIPQLIDHYKTTPINAEVNTRLINPVLSEQQKSQQKSKVSRQRSDEMYVTMERCKSKRESKIVAAGT
jgi:hypothetical protein